ncbi:MAG: hypothetical protein AAGB93_08265 [Planctomycetota bacterium]
MMRLTGSLLLTAGFLAGAYVSVAQVAAVNWLHYGLCAGLMVAGMVALRRARAVDLEQAGERHDSDIAVLQRSLAALIEKVRGFESAQGDEDQLTVYQRIDAELMEDIDAFVEARESMIPKLGMQRYADIMSPFANGERLLNRAWSASADGYVDEVRSCIAGARAELEKAAEQLASA